MHTHALWRRDVVRVCRCISHLLPVSEATRAMRTIFLISLFLYAQAAWGAIELSPRVTDADLKAFTEELLKRDVNNAGQYIRINYQSKTRSNSITDAAPQPLLVINNRALQIPTITKVHALFDNYIPDTAVNEHISSIERAEENSLLDTFLATHVMKHTMHFLTKKGFVTTDPKTHKDLLRQIWFTMYSRGGGKIGSSAFEHVFLGEMKRGEVAGMHNWIFFNNQENHRRADYMGYIRKLELGGKGAILKMHYKWDNVIKPVGSMFVGTSPELEMALYTVCFLARPDNKCRVSLGGKSFEIKTYTFRYRGKNMIGSAFPEI